VRLKSDTTAIVNGNFEFSIHEFGNDKKTNIVGEFNLEFYIGL